MNSAGRIRESSSRPPSASTSARASASPSPVDEPPDTPRSNTCGTRSSGTPAPVVGDLDDQAGVGRARRDRHRAPPWRSALSTSAPTASRMRVGVTRASSPSGSRTLSGRPAARRVGRHSSTTGREPLAQVHQLGARGPGRAGGLQEVVEHRGELLGLLQRGHRLAAGVGIGVGGQLVEPQLQRGDPAAQLVGDVAHQLPLALDQLGERGGGGVEHVGDPVELGDAVPARGGAEVARAEPGRPVGHAGERLGEPPRRDGGDDRARRHRHQHQQQHDQRGLDLLGEHRRARLLQGDRAAEPERQRLAHRVVADVHPDPPLRLAGLLQHEPPVRRHGELQLRPPGSSCPRPPGGPPPVPGATSGRRG